MMRSENFYAALRARLLTSASRPAGATAVLRDAETDYVPIPVSERLAQCIWYDQRVNREQLRATDGRPVRVVFQGWWNLEPGPDFTHATIQIGAEPAVTGAVEIHLRADDWFHHKHHQDPAYDRVILHVALWEAGSARPPRDTTGRAIPQLVLEQQLDSPLDALYDEIDLDSYPHNATAHAGRCARTLAEFRPEPLGALLAAAGQERFAAKTRRYARWAHRHGATQAFYEGWMEALGYKANKHGFRALAQRLPLAALAAHRKQLAPLLFGVANFLPVSATRDAETRKLWNAWWKLRPEFADRALAGADWKLGGSRPANHPHRRLGAAVALLKKHPNLLEKVTGAIETDGDPLKLFTQLREEYWSHHFTLGGRRLAAATDLIGGSRAREIVTNVVLPFVAAQARLEGDAALEEKAFARYAALPAAPSNSILRLAARQLFESAPVARAHVRSACQQQGLIQIFHDFCLNDRSGCAQCLFPELARQWADQPANR